MQSEGQFEGMVNSVRSEPDKTAARYWVRSGALAVSVLCASIWASNAQAADFGAGLTNTNWELEGDIFACEFRQPIPF